MKKITLTGLFLCLFLAFSSVADISGGGYIKLVDSNTINEKKDRDLVEAASNGYKKIVEILILHGANPNAIDEKGEAALTLAALYGHEEVVESLVKSGADINARNRSGSTAFMAASYLNINNEPVLKILIKYGADPNVKNHYRETALEWVSFNNRTETIKFLIENGAKGKTYLTEFLTDREYYEMLIKEYSQNTPPKKSCKGAFTKMPSNK